MRKIIILMLALLLVGSVIATITINNRNITLSKDYSNEAKLKDLETYNIVDYQKGNLYQRCLEKEKCSEEIVFVEEINENVVIQNCKSIINTCSSFMNQLDLDIWEEKRIEKILNASIERKTESKEKIGEGVTTIK